MSFGDCKLKICLARAAQGDSSSFISALPDSLTSAHDVLLALASSDEVERLLMMKGATSQRRASPQAPLESASLDVTTFVQKSLLVVISSQKRHRWQNEIPYRIVALDFGPGLYRSYCQHPKTSRHFHSAE